MRGTPQRTCVACRRVAPKPELLRIVRAGDGRIQVDPAGSAPGRGAYLHPVPDCLAGAFEGGRIARALRADVNKDEVGRLRSEIEAQMGAR